MSLFVLFPVGKEDSADAYLAACDAAWALLSPEDDGWYIVITDVHNQRYVGYLGPGGATWNGEPFIETPECEAARADGVIVSSIDMPEEE